MKTFFLTSNLLFTIFYHCAAQQNIGARLTSLGANAIAVSDNWNDNPASTNRHHNYVMAFSHIQYLFDPDLSAQALLIGVPIKHYVLGLRLYKYGFTVYNEINASISVSRHFNEHLSFGIKTNYHQLNITGYGATSAFTADAGLIFSTSPKYTFGLLIQHISSVSNPSANFQSYLVSNFQIGLAYQPTRLILISLNALKNFLQQLTLSFGIEYQILSTVYLRSGWNSKPFKQFAGFGIQHQNFMFDISIQNKNNLGLTPQISISYAF